MIGTTLSLYFTLHASNTVMNQASAHLPIEHQGAAPHWITVYACILCMSGVRTVRTLLGSYVQCHVTGLPQFSVDSIDAGLHGGS